MQLFMFIFAIPKIGGYDGPLWFLLLIDLIAFGIGVPALIWLCRKMDW